MLRRHNAAVRASLVDCTPSASDIVTGREMAAPESRMTETSVSAAPAESQCSRTNAAATRTPASCSGSQRSMTPSCKPGWAAISLLNLLMLSMIRLRACTDFPGPSQLSVVEVLVTGGVSEA